MALALDSAQTIWCFVHKHHEGAKKFQAAIPVHSTLKLRPSSTSTTPPSVSYKCCMFLSRSFQRFDFDMPRPWSLIQRKTALFMEIPIPSNGYARCAGSDRLTSRAPRHFSQDNLKGAFSGLNLGIPTPHDHRLPRVERRAARIDTVFDRTCVFAGAGGHGDVCDRWAGGHCHHQAEGGRSS